MPIFVIAHEKNDMSFKQRSRSPSFANFHNKCVCPNKKQKTGSPNFANFHENCHFRETQPPGGIFWQMSTMFAKLLQTPLVLGGGADPPPYRTGSCCRRCDPSTSTRKRGRWWRREGGGYVLNIVESLKYVTHYKQNNQCKHCEHCKHCHHVKHFKPF